MTSQDPHRGHLDAVSLARYVEGSAASDERRRIEGHLAECPDCRVELIESQRILAAHSPRRRWTRLVPLAAAAALFLVWTGTVHRPRTEPVTRDAAITATAAPLPVAPLGNVSRIDTLRWRAVPGVLQYRVTLFTGEGQVAWRTTTTDTFVASADTLRLVPATPYYWQVKAETSYGRWVESELVGFTLVPVAPR